VFSSSWGERPFGHDRYGPKSGGLCPFWEGELGPHLTQCGLGWGIPPYQVASWSIQPFGQNHPAFRHNRHRPKNGGCAPFLGGGESWLPSNTMSTGLRPTSVPSEILIYPLSGHNTWDENWGGGCVNLVGEGQLGPHLTQNHLGRGLSPYQVGSWSIQPPGHNTWAENWGLLWTPLLRRGSWVPI